MASSPGGKTAIGAADGGRPSVLVLGGGFGGVGAARKLKQALVGQSTRFTRQDGVEETWRIMQPLLDAPPPVHGYPQGSWGPAAADEIVAHHGGWHMPWLAS